MDVRWAAAVLAVAGLMGCGYFEVTDPTSGTKYYTIGHPQDVPHTGAVRFKDARNGAQVTLQSSVVRQVDEKTFQAATKEEEPKTP